MKELTQGDRNASFSYLMTNALIDKTHNEAEVELNGKENA